MHGHNMYILAQGTGTWDGSVVNAGNPQRRDVHILPVAVSATEPSYIVVQIDADNPGVWPLHCHSRSPCRHYKLTTFTNTIPVAWHVSAGLYINILERPRDIRRDMQIPSIMAQTCRDWSTYTGQDVVEQIDSGL